MADDAITPEEGWGAPQEQSYTPDESWGAPQQQSYRQDETADWGDPEEVHSSALGAGFRQAALNILPGAAGGVAGVGVGALAGTAALPSAPFTAGVGPVAASLAAGIPAGMAANYLTRKGEDWVLDMLGLRSGTGGLSEAQEMADRLEHPNVSFAAELGANTIPSFGTGVGKGGAMVGQRLLGGGLQGGMEAGSELYHGEELSPTKIGLATGAGALFAKPRGWLEGLTQRGSSAPNEPGRPRAPGLPPGPDEGPGSPSKPLNGEVLPPDQGSLAYDPGAKYGAEYENYKSQRDGFDMHDPMWKFWNDHMEQLQSREDGKGGVDVDASLGPASEEHPFTYQQGDRANDVTTVARGIAHENPPPPKDPNAGNPVGAPMQGRVAQRPIEPGRNYGKGADVNSQALITQESKSVSTAPIHEDIAAALKGEQPEAAQPQEVANASPPPAPDGGAAAGPPAVPGRAPQSAQPAEGQAPGQEAARPQAPGGQEQPLSPHEQRVLDHTMDILNQAGMSRVIEKLQEMPPRAAAEAATKVLTALQSKTGEATAAGSAGEVRLPGVRPQVEGMNVTARSKADAERKQGVLKAYDDAVAKFGTAPEGETNGGLLDRIKQMVAHADELSGGNTYRPNVKPPAWQVIKAARQALSKPTPKNIDAYRAAETALGKGADAETATDFQQTSRIDADIENKPQLEEGAAEANIEREAAETNERPEHELFNNDSGDESAVYTAQHNNMTNWLNGLSDASHSMLLKEHPDLATNVKTTQDPNALHNTLMSDLADMQRKAATFEAVPGENAPVVKRTQIKNRDDLAATEPGAAATQGKSLKGSAEFDRLAAQYAQAPAKKGAIYDLDHEEAAMRGQGETLKPVDGSEASLWDHMRDMMNDESGSVPMDKFFTNAAQWMKDKVTDWTSRKALDPIREYADALGGGFGKLSNRLTRFKGELIANARAAQFPDGTTPVAAEKSRIYRAMENGETGTLPGKLKDYYDSFVKPLAEKYGPMYDEFKQLATELKVPGYEDLVDRVNNGNGFKNWAPRILKGKHSWDAADDIDPVTGRGNNLSAFAETTQNRDWFSLQDSKGNRFTYIPGEGKMTRMSNGAPSTIKFKDGNFDPAQVGATLKLKRGGKEDMWTVDHATIDEIKAASGGKMDYHDSPVLAYSNAIYGLNNALEKMRTLKSIIESPEFQANSTTKGKVANENGWIETKLPQLAGRYMAKPIAWALDDFVKKGLPIDNAALDTIRNVGTTAAKIFYFFGPAVHAFNEADKWAVGRGFNWVTPQGYKSLIVNGAKAAKSVWTQDAIQREMTDAGANPMLMHTLTRDTMGKVARATGDDIMKNPSKWDPFARAFGVSTKELGSRAYEASSAGMWMASDVLLTQRYLEEKARLGGDAAQRNQAMLANIDKTVNDPAEQKRDPAKVAHLKAQGDAIRAQLADVNAKAVKSAHDFIDSYQMPVTVGGNGEGGRLAQQFLTDPATSLFGPYHYGVFHTLANMAKNLVKPDATMAERTRTAGQWAVQAAMLFAAYPLLSAAYSKLTGNEHSEFERRGVSRLIGTAGDIISGKKGVQDALRNVWTPSVPADTAIRQVQNMDWRGKPIIQPTNMTESPLRRGMRAVGQEAEFLAGQMVSPYKVVSNAMQTPGATVGSVAQKFAESNLGLKTPSPGAQKFENKREKTQRAQEKGRMKHPGGLIESGTNWLTE